MEPIERLTLGERIAWYRRRRGMSQTVLAGLVGRTPDWLSKVETGHIILDRLSIMRLLAQALDVPVGGLVDDMSMVPGSNGVGSDVVPVLRAALMHPVQLGLHPLGNSQPAQRSLPEIESAVQQVCSAYQSSRYGTAANLLPGLLADNHAIAEQVRSGQQRRALVALALTYQAAASVLIKVGEAELAFIAAERGLAAANRSSDLAVAASLLRSVVFNLAAVGSLPESVALANRAVTQFRPDLRTGDPRLMSAFGTLLLASSMAAARGGDREAARVFLGEASDVASQVSADRNLLWTAFGPTNVAIHQISTAMELADVQVALRIGENLDTAALPAERRVRHQLDMARAYDMTGKREKAVAAMMRAAQLAPEQVRYHHISKRLMLGWLRSRMALPRSLDTLAVQMKVVGATE